MEADAPVEIARFINVQQAEMALSLLRANGIDGYLDQPFTASIAPHYMFGSGGVRLFVRAREVERAKELLHAPGDETDVESSDWS